MPLFRTRISPLLLMGREKSSKGKEQSTKALGLNNSTPTGLVNFGNNNNLAKPKDCEIYRSNPVPSAQNNCYNNNNNHHVNNKHHNNRNAHYQNHYCPYNGHPQLQPVLESTVLPPTNQQQAAQPQLAFYCQLAHGSRTALISGFENVRELYQKIAESFDILPEDILFCTLNTHRLDMVQLLGAQIGLDDFIYAHRKGRPKEIELIKIEDSLGLTLTDNGAGHVFIKRIKENSVMDRLKVVQVGDHIEKINGLSLVGRKHFEVAKMLKDIDRGSQFTLRLVEPLTRSGFGIIGPRYNISTSTRRGRFIPYGITGKETLRFKADGCARIENMVECERDRIIIDKINNLLDFHMGICDKELARRLWEIAENKINSMDLVKALESLMPIEATNFSSNFLFEVWRVAFEARCINDTLH